MFTNIKGSLIQLLNNVLWISTIDTHKICRSLGITLNGNNVHADIETRPRK